MQIICSMILQNVKVKNQGRDAGVRCICLTLQAANEASMRVYSIPCAGVYGCRAGLDPV